ncbi:MAG: alternative ribosome rescue aminoacyl-tRNA hydrolase ArfB [Candidatus Magasanikbacteria bacterium]
MDRKKRLYIPESELRITFARSSGAGGQNVNKTSTKVIIHWNVGASAVLLDEQRQRIRVVLRNRLNSEDEIVVMSEEERSQIQNREIATVRLQKLVNEALYIPKKRKPTRPTYASKLKRLTTKKIRSDVKKYRKKNFDE